MSAYPEPSSIEEQPEPFAALTKSRVLVEAWLMTVDRQLGARFLENVAAVINTRAEMLHVVPIRRNKRAAAKVAAERVALADIRQDMAVWVARLNDR